MEDNLGLFRSWICKQIENTEETYDPPEDLSHIDSNDFVDVLQYVKAELDELCEYAFDEEELTLD